MTTSPLKVEDSRAQFEAWFKTEIIETPDFVFNEFDEKDNEYIVGEDDNEELYLNIQAMFMAWQASRAAIALDIDWPEANDDTWKEGVEGAYAMGHEDGKDKVVIAVRQALRAAGITVKGDSDGK